MKNCIIPILIFILFMLVYQCSRAQDYVVTSKSDTIRGEVKAMTYGLEKKVQVTTADKKKTVLTITQTLGYSYKGEIFHPIRNEKGYVFMKLLHPGYLSLYGYQMENQMSYDGRYLVKKDGSRLDVPNLGFKKLTMRFLADCEEVFLKIDNGQLSKRDIDEIINQYNVCIQNKTSLTNKIITQTQEASKKISSWDVLEQKLKAEPEFAGKKDALDMVAEIKNKINRSEKVPNFLLEGLKSSLSATNLTAELDNALKDLNN